jgi:hypothetical protein
MKIIYELIAPNGQWYTYVPPADNSVNTTWSSRTFRNMAALFSSFFYDILYKRFTFITSNVININKQQKWNIIVPVPYKGLTSTMI